MDINLKTSELTDAVKLYITNLGIDIEDKLINVKITRGGAVVNIADSSTETKPYTGAKRGRKPKKPDATGPEVVNEVVSLPQMALPPTDPLDELPATSKDTNDIFN